MGKRSEKSPEEKAAAVLAVLGGELTAVAAARVHGVSEQTIHNWKAAFLQGGRDRLAAARARRPRDELTRLQAEIDALSEALREARVQLRVYQRGVHLLPPTQTSR